MGQWQFFRNRRNNLAHDYPESMAQTIETLNILYQEIHVLKEMYRSVRDLWLQRSHSRST